MSHLKAILFRRDRLWLAALLGAVGLVAVAAYTFYFTQQREAEAWSTSDTGYASNAVSSDTVAMGEQNILILDITLPDPTTDTLIHNGGSFTVAAENALTDFGANDRFSDDDHDNGQDFVSGALIVNSADTTITSGEVVTAGTAGLLQFTVDDTNMKFGDVDNDDSTSDYSGVEVLVRSADTTITTGEVITAGTANLTAFDTTEPGLEIHADDGTDNNVLDSNEDIYRQIHDGADVFTSGLLLEDFATSEVFADNDMDGSFDSGEAILSSADSSLTAGALSGAGTDTILTGGTAAMTAFASSDMFFDNDADDNGIYVTAEAIANDADADGSPTAGTLSLKAGKAAVDAFEAGDNVWLDDLDNDNEYDTGEVIWWDSANDGTAFSAGVDYVLVGAANPTLGDSVQISGVADGLAYLDDNADGLFTSTRNTSAEVIVNFGDATTPTIGLDLALTVQFLDPAQLADDDINGTWLEDLNAFAVTDKYCEDGVAGYDATEAIVSQGSADSSLEAGDTVITTGTCNLTNFAATQFFVSAGESYAGGDDIFERITNGGAAGGDEVEVRILDGIHLFSDFDHDGIYDDTELVALSADTNLADAEIVIGGSVDVNAFSADFRFSDADNDTNYTTGELIANTADASLAGGEIVLSGTVDVTAFDSSSSPYYKYHDGSAGASYTDGEDIVTDDDDSGWYNADVVTGTKISNAGTALDADIDNMIFWQEDGTTAGFQSGEDTSIYNDNDGTFFASAETYPADGTIWSVYSTGSDDQRFYVTVNIDATGGGDGDPTNAATIIATLDPSTGGGDGTCSSEGEAACSILLASATIGSGNSGGDGPEGAGTVTSAGTITIDSAVPTISAVYTLDGLVATPPSTCTNANNIDAAAVDGVIDAVCIEFSESVLDSTVLSTDFAVTSETVSGVRADGEGNDQYIFLTLSAGFFSTDGTPNLAYTAGTLTDSNGNPLATDLTTASTDAAPPAIISSQTLDDNGDGTIDQLLLTFSEGTKIVDGAVGDGFAPLTLTASSGTATIDSANYGVGSTTTLTLNITPSATNDTGVTISATYDDDADATKGICDDDVSNANCVVDYATANQMIDGAVSISETDGAAPVVRTASTTSDNDISILFSESVTGAVAGDLTTNNAAVSFASVSAASGATIVWQNATTAWNTDATGSDAGTGTDSTGTVRTTVPDLTMSAGAVADSTGNPIAVLASDDRTVDAAAPIALSSSYLDVTSVDGTIDRVDVVFSEDIAVTYDGSDWTFSTAGGMNPDDTGASVSGDTLRLAISADASETGGVAPHLQYTNNASRLTDQATTPVAADSFNTGAIDDAAAPYQLSAVYQDSDTDGDVDRIAVTTSTEATLNCAYEAGDWSFPATGSNSLAEGGSTTCSTAGGNTVYLSVLTSDANETGGPVSPTVLYSNADADSSITDGTNAMATWGAALTAADNASPKVLSGEYRDSIEDGSIGSVVLTTTLDFNLACTALTTATDFTVNTAGTIALATTGGDGCSDNGTSAFTLSGMVGTDDTTGGPVEPVISYTQPGNGLEDGAGNDVLTFASLTLTDGANPIILLRETRDGDADGKLDGIDVTFSEPMDDDSIVSAPVAWAVSTYTGEGIVTGATADDALLRVTFTEGASGDTDAVPTVAFTSDGLADLSGNLLSTAAAVASTDEAAPVIFSSSPTDGENNVDEDDNFTITFSEPMTTAGVEAAFSISPDPTGAETFAWDGSNEIATINPAAELDRNEDYTITFAATAASAAAGDPDLALTTIDFETQGTSSSSGGGGGGGGTSSTTPSISISSPVGTDEVDGGDTLTIEWASSGSGINSVKLYYSVNGGDNYSLIASGLDRSDTYDWTVPNTTTNAAIIKVIALDSGAATLDTDMSGVFSINLSSDLPEDEVPSSDSAELMSRDEANASLPDGIEVDDLVRGTLPAVYYIGLDAKRHPFPNEQIYFTWFENFDSVQVISDEDLADVSLGTPVLTRPGTMMVKIVSDPKTYVVTPGYELRWVTSEDAAVALFGSTWNQRIMDVEPTYFTHFSFGEDITDGTYPDGSLVKTADSSTVYYIDGSERRALTAEGMDENFFQDRFVTTSSDDSWMDFDLGDEIEGLEDAIFSALLP